MLDIFQHKNMPKKSLDLVAVERFYFFTHIRMKLKGQKNTVCLYGEKSQSNWINYKMIFFIFYYWI